ncbi:class I SAM-dependent methyltransferase [Heliorestis convoluta]|uniref:SAM-dependent methyltransferase n=1 Tax=Heliorestis convoluta TaxID=356322 RepID=A0A5Q2MZF5_9FIRM|nr:class I SAM-dependent methyltransferase [Heliorestis convoluta]QGG46823.1 hypothetical protein FTV88_0644 [Heliorestis convoluta]
MIQKTATVIVTTSHDDEILQKRASEKATLLGLPFVERKKQSLEKLYERYNCSKVLVLERQRWVLKSDDGDFFFHPNMASLRILALQRGEKDYLAQALQLQPGDAFLDCTLGQASDAIVASYLVGEEGKVLGIEHNPFVAFIVAEGLRNPEKEWAPPLAQAMARILIKQGDHRELLLTMSEKSYDVVYFDPMFRQEIKVSSGIHGIRQWADRRPISLEALEQAKKIARRRVVIKERKYSPEWDRLKPTFIISSNNMKVAYGVWEKEVSS